jgi:uncharacterized protein YndB with AHSA1/START domain
VPRITISDYIAAPVDQVFRLFTDVASGAGRISGIKHIEMLTPGPIRLGSRWRETRDVFGVDDSAEMEITSYERNRTYTITHQKAGVQISTAFWFEPANGGTKVSVECELERGGLPPGLLAPLGWAISGTVASVLSHDLADFKQFFEG